MCGAIYTNLSNLLSATAHHSDERPKRARSSTASSSSHAALLPARSIHLHSRCRLCLSQGTALRDPTHAGTQPQSGWRSWARTHARTHNSTYTNTRPTMSFPSRISPCAEPRRTLRAVQTAPSQVHSSEDTYTLFLESFSMSFSICASCASYISFRFTLPMVSSDASESTEEA